MLKLIGAGIVAAAPSIIASPLEDTIPPGVWVQDFFKGFGFRLVFVRVSDFWQGLGCLPRLRILVRVLVFDRVLVFERVWVSDKGLGF
jgi:hypothetical protein